jgi:hypothetical protein
MVNIPKTGNSIPPPPRLIGNAEQDQLVLLAWVTDIYRALVLEVNVIGSVRSLLERTENLEGDVSGLTDRIKRGKGSPEGVVKAPVGTLYLREDGGPGTTLYVKESGASAFGWVAK